MKVPIAWDSEPRRAPRLIQAAVHYKYPLPAVKRLGGVELPAFLP